VRLYKVYGIIFVERNHRKELKVMDLKTSETSALVEVIKEQNLIISSLRETIDQDEY